MAVGDIYAALDIGSNALRLIRGVEQADGTLIIENALSRPSKNIVEGKVMHVGRVRVELERLLKDIKLSSVNIHLCHHSLLGTNNLSIAANRGRVTWNTVAASVEGSNEWLADEGRYKEYYPNDYMLNNTTTTKNPFGESASTIQTSYHLVSIEKDVIEDIRSSVNSAGLEVIEFCIGLKATADLLLTQAQKQTGVILVDIGHELVKIVAYHKGNMMLSAAFSVSGATIEEEIMKYYNCSFSEATKLKEDYGFVDNTAKEEDSIISYESLEGERYLSVHDLSLIVTAVFERIFTTILSKLELYNIPYKKYGSGMVLVGGHTQIEHLRAYAIGSMQTKVTLGKLSVEFLREHNIALHPKINVNKIIGNHEYLHALAALVYSDETHNESWQQTSSGSIKLLGKLKKTWNNLFKPT